MITVFLQKHKAFLYKLYSMNGWESMKTFMNHCQTFSEENKYDKSRKARLYLS